MHLKRLFIKNFRSIAELDLTFEPGKNVIIGRNNSGKSNIIKALDLVLGEYSPAWNKSENITEADFHSGWKTDANGQRVEFTENTLFIFCELERETGEGLNWHEITSCAGYSYHGTRGGYNSPGTPIRLVIQDLGNDYTKIFAPKEDPGPRVWVDPKLQHQAGFEQQLSNKYSFAYAFLAEMTDRGIEKHIRFLYREGEDEDWVLGFRATIRTELLQSTIMPSFRDPAVQLRLNQWSWYGKLLRYLTKGCSEDWGLLEAMEKMKKEGDRVFKGITDKLHEKDLAVSFPGAKISFQFNADTQTDMFKSCVIYVDDGFKSLLTDKGAGIQSATIIGLFVYYTKHVHIRGSSLLCIEEPELYLHPHARRSISDRLDEFLDGKRNQVIVTTHAVEFLRTTVTTFNLVLIKKSPLGATTAHAIKAREFLPLLVNNNQNEMFFADKVLLCEGLDEHILRAAADELYPSALDQQNVSIVSVEGKDKLITMVETVLKLDLQCFIVADFDFLLRDENPPKNDKGEYTYDTKPRKSAQNLPQKFFAQTCTFGPGNSMRTEIQRLREQVRTDKPEEFYQAKHAAELLDVNIYAFLDKLRTNGLCILEGQIEDLVKDRAALGMGDKMKLTHIYHIREHITDGGKLSDLLDLTPLNDCFVRIFGTPTAASVASQPSPVTA